MRFPLRKIIITSIHTVHRRPLKCQGPVRINVQSNKRVLQEALRWILVKIVKYIRKDKSYYTKNLDTISLIFSDLFLYEKI